jgi:hypothetical protein
MISGSTPGGSGVALCFRSKRYSQSSSTVRYLLLTGDGGTVYAQGGTEAGTAPTNIRARRIG